MKRSIIVLIALLMLVAPLIVACGETTGYCKEGWSISYPKNQAYPFGMCKNAKGDEVEAATSKPQWIIDGHRDTVIPGDVDSTTKGAQHLADGAQNAGNPVTNVSKGLDSASTAAPAVSDGSKIACSLVDPENRNAAVQMGTCKP